MTLRLAPPTQAPAPKEEDTDSSDMGIFEGLKLCFRLEIRNVFSKWQMLKLSYESPATQ